MRLASGPAGAHAVSGSWRIQKEELSDNALTSTYKGTSDGMMLSMPTGESYEGKYDGKDYPLEGAEGYTVALGKVNDRALIWTVKRDGKVVAVYNTTVSADGKTMTMKIENKLQGTTTTYKAIKQ
jgi:hypothetical protein